jgi:D-alanyl-D-alanine carboxypeptidase
VVIKDRNRRLNRIVAAVIAFAVVLAGPALPALAKIDQAFVTAQVAKVKLGNKAGSLQLVIIEPDGTVLSDSAGQNPGGDKPTPTDNYRVGSITKMFTSTIVLTLVDEGKVDLDAPASQYITRVEVPTDATVRQLLNHTSGIFNYTDLPAFEEMIGSSTVTDWTPEEIIALIDGQPSGDIGDFSYSNTNYILLGILIEEITGQPYADVLSERIFEPLGLKDTYLAGYQEGTAPVGAYEKAPGGWSEITWDYTPVAQLAWSAGAIVSNAPDLATFATALFGGDLISAASLAEMTDTKPEDYGLGLMSNSSTPGIYGHEGGIPGYTTLLAYSVDTGRTAFWAVTNEDIDFLPAVFSVFTTLGEP